MSVSGTIARTAIGWRAGQQAGIQAVYFLRLLILARLLAPEAFGQVAIAMLVISILLSVTDLGVIPALVQRESATREEHDAAWTVAIGRAALIALVLWIAAPFVAALFGEARTTPVIRLLGLKPLLEALGSIGVARLIRDLRFRELAMMQVPAAVVDVGVAVMLASTVGVWALVAGSLAGAATSTLLSYVLAPHRPRLVFRVATAAPLIRFGRWVLGTNIIGLIATSSVQLVVSRQLGVTELGLYFLATKVAFLPADATGTVIGSVSFPLYASMQQDDRGTTATLRWLLSAQATFLFPVYVLMIVLAPSLSEALGPGWSGTAPLIRIIGLAAVIGLYADTIQPLLMGRGRADSVMTVVGAQTGVLLVLIWPFVSAFGVIGAAAAWLPAYAAALVASIVFVRRAIPRPLADAERPLLVLLLVSVAGGLAAALPQAWLDGPSALAGGILLGLATTATLLGGISRHMQLGIRELLGVPAT